MGFKQKNIEKSIVISSKEGIKLFENSISNRLQKYATKKYFSLVFYRIFLGIF